MKKTSLLLALPAVALSGLLLSGCGAFRSHKAWDTALQEAPLEIPPTLDRPSTTEALVIPPPGANLPTSSGATARTGSMNGQISDGFVLASNVDEVYRKVGQALEGGAMGELVAHDDTAHSYTLNVSDAVVQQKKKGFFSRMFGHDKNSSLQAPAAGSRQVQVSVNTSGSTGSEVRATGNPAVVSKVVDLLKARLGG
ncbi:hypothetical protein PY254_13990 [Rhodanobacter sp. AS-Z3]|uniref:hypothetical protein n=1 Tax=Rhodanobacter sp. AS-Z3 TaxID=3031330 RepID=UPI00247B1314|nr:hypothetical protein [Rhodanobacter sp. AS-Z3]WEN14337.1 hypothetical protein PY254_13990 [Rhodanobacter sp. AS-Z3]